MAQGVRDIGLARAAAVYTGQYMQPGRKALISAKVLGQQTVSRGETWAAKCVMQMCPGGKHLTIVTDARWLVQGFLHHKWPTYVKGSNWDIWKSIYGSEAKMRVKPRVERIKSHVTVEEVRTMSRRNRESPNWLYVNKAAGD